MRVFIAIDLAIKVVDNLVLLQEDLHRPITNLDAKPRWVQAANIHLTLKFLGDQEPDRVLRVREVLEEVGRRHPILEVVTCGTGCFPTLTKPRIVWAGSGEGTEAVERLQQDIEESLEGLGIPRETREFHPHVTIGRIKTKKKRVDLEPVLAPFRDTVFGKSIIKSFALFQSTLTPKGAIYNVIQRFPLTG